MKGDYYIAQEGETEPVWFQRGELRQAYAEWARRVHADPARWCTLRLPHTGSLYHHCRRGPLPALDMPTTGHPPSPAALCPGENPQRWRSYAPDEVARRVTNDDYTHMTAAPPCMRYG